MTDQHPLGEEVKEPQQGDVMVRKMIIAVGVLGVLILVVRLLFPLVLNLILTLNSTGDCPSTNPISINELAQQIQRGNVEEVIIRGGQDVCVLFRNGTVVIYHKEREDDMFDNLRTLGVEDAQLQQIIYSEMPG